MYCKKCGKEIADDSVFCKHCGANQTTIVTRPSNQPIKVDVNANVEATVSKSYDRNIKNLSNVFKSMSGCVKTSLTVYFFWLVAHVLLLINGHDRDHFFPYLRKLSHIYDRRIVDDGYELDWDIGYYGATEFITYVIVIPCIIFLLAYFYRKNKKTIVQFGERHMWLVGILILWLLLCWMLW